MQEHDFDFERYKSLDFSNAKPLRQNPKFKKLQDDLKNMQPQNDLAIFFDSDVQEAIRSHNSPKDRERLNTVIRMLFA